MGAIGRGVGLVVAASLLSATPASARSLETVTRGADGNSYRPSISNDGRYVAFESNADSLSRADDDRVRNVYVRDMRTGGLTLVSRASGGVAADAASSEASISADGRSVAFESRARNLGLAGLGGRETGVFVRDLELGVTRPSATASPRRSPAKAATWRT